MTCLDAHLDIEELILRGQNQLCSFLLLVWLLISKFIMVLKLILDKSKKNLLFNSTIIDFGYFFVDYISKSDFD